MVGADPGVDHEGVDTAATLLIPAWSSTGRGPARRRAGPIHEESNATVLLDVIDASVLREAACLIDGQALERESGCGVKVAVADARVAAAVVSGESLGGKPRPIRRHRRAEPNQVVSGHAVSRKPNQVLRVHGPPDPGAHGDE